ncbi:MAG: hypothetical protein HKN63_01335 [Rhodobacteraceae bacterium]|nr:hypothetical protein [Paracoccaceae bacterium]
MANPKDGKHVKFKINTTQEFLDSRGLTIDKLKESLSVLAEIFGLKYERLFPTKISSEHIDRILHVSELLGPLRQLPGFNRHIKLYDKNNFDDHLFAARTASWLVGQGISVEFEPVTAVDQKDPDLKCERDGGPTVYVECKRMRTDKFFDLDAKQSLADLIYENLPTCDQLSFYLHHEGSADKVRQLVPDKNFAPMIFAAGLNAEDSDVNVEGEFRVNVLRRPAIIGSEEDFLTVTAGGWLQDVYSGVRLPGYFFMRGGRSIGVHGPPPDYSNLLNNKRHKSKQQSIPGSAYVVIMQDEDFLGDPEEHERFFRRVWLTVENSEFSGIGVLGFAHMPDEPSDPKFRFSLNPDAACPLPEDFFEPS